MLGALESYCTSEHQSIGTNACLLVTCTNECVTVILLTNDTYCGSLYGRFAAHCPFLFEKFSVPTVALYIVYLTDTTCGQVPL
jgi:hypothetical protein